MGNPLSHAFERDLGAIVGATAEAGPRATELAVDRVLDKRYRVLEPLGVGGSSQVYLAEDTVLGREVAVKVLDAAAAADGALRRLFVKEARALAQLSHPNIVAVYDVGEVDGLPFIVMEHIGGASLKQRIDRSGALPVADAIRIATEVANGLAFAHSRGIVHADLKPSNILIDANDRPRVVDFGIARTPQEEAETPQLFATALYVAPERVEGKSASVASDVYGLGLVLYEILVGKPPFTSANAAVLLRDHVVRQPVPPSHLRPSLPKELDAIVLKALAKDPALRYPRASDMATELQRIETLAEPLATTARLRDTSVMAEPIQDFVPHVTESPVVAFIAAHGQPIRRGFFGFFAGLPLFALMLLAGFGAVPALLAGAFVAFVGFIGWLGAALAVAWIVETVLIFLFVPGLALLFALMGLWLWLREVPAERTALALAMPVSAPFGFAPALLLTSAAVQGISGVVTVGWGAVLTVLFAIASGQQSFGPFVQTGLSLEQDTLFNAVSAADMKGALIQLVQSSENRLGPLFDQLDPQSLWHQLEGVVSRMAGADVSIIATIFGWTVAALTVWGFTRLLRGLFDALLNRPRRWFALYVFATTVGVLSGAALLYMLFVTWSPLALAPGRPADGALFVSALTGALVAIAAGVVIGATERPEKQEEPLPAMAARRLPVR